MLVSVVLSSGEVFCRGWYELLRRCFPTSANSWYLPFSSCFLLMIYSISLFINLKKGVINKECASTLSHSKNVVMPPNFVARKPCDTATRHETWRNERVLWSCRVQKACRASRYLSAATEWSANCLCAVIFWCSGKHPSVLALLIAP